MTRRIFNLAAVISLLLCLASIALWIRSAWRVDGISLVTRQNAFVEFYATEGLGVTCIRQWPEPAGIRHLGWNLQGTDEEARLGHVDPKRVPVLELPLVLYSGYGGAFTEGWYRWGFGISSGKACVPVDEDGRVLRGITSFPPRAG